MKPAAKGKRNRITPSLSEDETYGRFVHQASLDAGGTACPSPRRSESSALLSASDLAQLSPTTTRPSVSTSESLWMEVLDSSRLSGGKAPVAEHGRVLDGVDASGQSCLPFRGQRSSRAPNDLPLASRPSSTSAHSPSSPVLRDFDRSPSADRRGQIQALAGTTQHVHSNGRERLGPGNKPKLRRDSSILNSFTCDLVATDIVYEVPLAQPSKLEKLQAWAMDKAGSVCQGSSRSDSYDVEKDVDSVHLSDLDDGRQSPPDSVPSGSGSVSQDGKWRKVLHKISLEAVPGKMIAILGGSGSGKTSFLDVLSGRSPPECKVSGKLTINGAEVQRSSEELKFCVGYVTQSIFLLPNLTVEETLLFVALLRLPKSLTHQDKLNRVSEALQFLSLEPLRNRLIGGEETKGLSGGQQRLVSIATQMIYNPGVLILDEPTSGLDSYTAEHVCKTLHNLAMRRSRAILLTIHQPGPEITQLFDHVLILSSGHTIYNGPADQLVKYFNSLGYTLPEFTNPCDYYVDLATLDTRSSVREQHSRSCFDFLVNAHRDFVAKLWDLDEEPDEEEDLGMDQDIGDGRRGTPMFTPTQPSKGQLTSFASRRLIHQRRSAFISSASIMKVPPTRPKSINAFQKFAVLLRRTVRNELRDFNELLAQMLQAALLSILFGLVFIGLGEEPADLRNRKAVLFIAFTLYPFMAVFETIAKYAGQQMMTFHEMLNGLYTSTPFGLAKIIGEMPGNMVLSVTYSIPLYFMSSLRLEPVEAYFKFLLLLHLLLQISRTMALAAGVISQSPNFAALAANLMYTGWILTAGYIININNLWDGVKWIAFVSPIRYAFQGAAISELSGRQFWKAGCSGNNATQAANATCPAPLSGDADLEDLAFDTLTYGQCVAILGGMYTCLLAAVLVGLHLRRNSRPE